MENSRLGKKKWLYGDIFHNIDDLEKTIQNLTFSTLSIYTESVKILKKEVSMRCAILFARLASYRKRRFNLYGNLFLSLVFLGRLTIEFFYFVIYTKRAGCIIVKNTDFGAFANVFLALGMIEFCKVNKINLILDYTNPSPYSLETKDNILLYCFEKYSFTFNQNKNKRIYRTKYNMINAIALITRQFSGITPERIRENINLMGIREDILEEVNAFYKKYFINKKVIGIHYRGTDSSERNITSTYMSYNNVIDYLLKNFQGEYYFYVATDEERFLTNMEKNFPNRIISYNVARSENNQAIHKDPLRQKKAPLMREVMIDSLLLAKTSFLIRLDSGVSLFSILYNKGLKFITLGNKEFPLRKKIRNEIDKDEMENVDIMVLS